MSCLRMSAPGAIVRTVTNRSGTTALQMRRGFTRRFAFAVCAVLACALVPHRARAAGPPAPGSPAVAAAAPAPGTALGDFSIPQPPLQPNLARTDWTAMQALDGTVRALLRWNGHLYAGGDFTHAGTTVVNGIAMWDGTQWNALGTGVVGKVLTLCEYGGELWVGGDFELTGNSSFTGLVSWDGSTWTKRTAGLTSGSRITVRALLVTGQGEFYAGGEFGACAQAEVHPINVARWDSGSGGTWTTLRAPAPGDSCIGVLAEAGLVAGIYLDQFGVVEHGVHCLLEFDGWLIMGGYFNDLAGPGTSSIGAVASLAAWNGQSWIDVGGFTNGLVHDGIVSAGAVLALANFQSELYAAGSFDYAVGAPVSQSSLGIARWEGGQNWNDLGWDSYSIFRALRVHHNALVLGGDFTRVPSGISSPYITQWNGCMWDDLPGAQSGAPFTGPVHVLYEGDGVLYAGGEFDYAGGTYAPHVAYWWEPFGNAFWYPDCSWNVDPGAVVSTASPLSDGLYVGGTFVSVGSLATNGIARWDGAAWHSYGSGVAGGAVRAVMQYNGETYIGGDFTSAGGDATIKYLARWNGTAWVKVGSGLNGPVYALAVAPPGGPLGNSLFVGGAFTNDNNVSHSFLHVVAWQGSAFAAAGSGLSGGTVPAVYAFTIHNGSLYAGGTFASSGATPVSGLARWEDKRWRAVGGGLKDNTAAAPTVFALASYRSRLAVGGKFTTAVGTVDIATSNLAFWDGVNYTALAAGVNDTVRALAVSPSSYGGTDLFVGGDFDLADTVGVSGIALWHETARGGDGLFSSPGSGVAGSVNALAPYGTAMYVGGSFTEAGAQPATALATYALSAVSAIGDGEVGPSPLPRTALLRAVGPVPSRGPVSVSYRLPLASRVRLAVFNAAGRQVAVLVEGVRPAGDHGVVWDGRDARGAAVGTGVYYARLTYQGGADVRRLVILR